MATLLIAAPASRFTDDVRSACIDAALAGAGGISRALGYVSAGLADAAPFAGTAVAR